MIPTVSSVSTSAYEAARRRAGLIDRADRGRIILSGKDRGTYLHGLMTNDIAALAAGEGCYSAYLTPQGRMITDLWAYQLGDRMLLTLARDVKDTVIAKLDQFIFTEDVQLADATGPLAQMAVVGPDAASMVASALGVERRTLADLREHGSVCASFEGQPAIALRVSDTGEPGYDVLVEANLAGALADRVRAAGAVDVDAAVAEALRIEAGIPRFHRDMDEETIPLEAGIESRAISFTKGCYVGQEVIVRVLHRGHGRVARKLVGLTFDGEAVPAPGTPVQAEGREVGRVTSSTWSPAVQRPIGLAYLQRDFVEPGTAVSAGGAAARVTALPFLPRPA